MKRNIPQWLDTASRLLHGAVILVSVLLIVYVSYDILNGIALVNAKRYLNFQLFVCIIFLTSLAVDWHISKHRCRFFIYLCGIHIIVFRKLGLRTVYV